MAEQTAPATRFDAGQVSGLLAGRIEALVREILPGGRRHGQEWTVGSVAGEAGSSCSIHLSGRKAGVWADFATGECGDALDLVAAVCARGDRKQAYRWALGWLGLSGASPIAALRATHVLADPARDARAIEDEAAKRRSAQAMWLSARPTIGTPAADYLSTRGIDLTRLRRSPRALRFHPNLFNAESKRCWPAMVAAVSNGEGEHVATHRTWLAQSGGLWRKAPLHQAKMVLGRPKGGSIRLNRGLSNKALAEAEHDEEVIVGEGIETCLSVAVACPERRVLCGVAMPYIATIDLPEQVRRVLVLLDNDVNEDARRGADRVLRALLATGREIRIARSPRGKDFNDAIAPRLRGAA